MLLKGMDGCIFNLALGGIPTFRSRYTLLAANFKVVFDHPLLLKSFNGVSTISHLPVNISFAGLWHFWCPLVVFLRIS
jgi:hypothetical protein